MPERSSVQSMLKVALTTQQQHKWQQELGAPAGKFTTNIDELVDSSIGSMTVSRFNMKKSTLTPSGPIYETLWHVQ